MQYAGSMETARALAGTTARFAAGSDALAELVRQRQDLQRHWQALDGAWVEAVSHPKDKRNAEGEAALRKDMADVDAKLIAADIQLRERDSPASRNLRAPSRSLFLMCRLS